MPKPPLIARDHLQSVVRLGRRAGRFWWVAATAIALGIAATLAVAKLRPKQYRSEAVVYYQEGMQWTQVEGTSARRIGQRLKDMLLARARLAKLIEEFGLYPDLVKAGRTPEAIEEMRLATGFRVSEGDVFVISFTGDSPGQAQRVTVRLTETLIEENAELRASQAEVARAFLDAEKKRNEAELGAREAALLGFLTKHPEFAHEPTTIGAALRARPKESGTAAPAGNGVLAALRREEERLRRQLATPGQIPQPPGDPALVAAKNQAEAALRTAQRELADRRARFTEEHPDVRTAAAMVKEATEAYKRASDAATATQKAVTPAELEARLAQVRQDIADHRRKHPEDRSARDESADSSRAAQRIVALETDWARLTREVAEARERLQELDARQFMASMTASTVVSGQAAQIVVIDPAFLPAKPIGMSKTRLLLMGLLMSLTAGVGAAVLCAWLDDRAYDHVDVERLELAPVLIELTRDDLAQLEAPGAHQARGGGGHPDDAHPEPSPSPLSEQRDAPRTTAAAALLEAPREDVPAREGPGPDPAATLVGEGAPQPVEGWSVSGDAAGVAPQVSTAVQLAQVADVGPRLTVLGSQAVRAPGPGGGLPDVVQVQRMQGARKYGSRLLMLDSPDSHAAAAFRMLRHRLGARDVRTILVTSPSGGEGKTLCAVNLALALGEEGRARVLLLEGNCRSPALARLLDFEPPVCIRDQLDLHRAQRTVPWVVVEAGAPWLHTMAVAPGENARPFLDGPALACCIEDLRRAGYDHVVIDGPSVLGSADVNLLEECVDGVLLTMRARQSRVRDLRKAVEQIGGGKVVGIALLGT